jgi:hypothetical protein
VVTLREGSDYMHDCYDSKHRSNIMNLQQCGPIPSNTRRCHARSGSISPSAQSAEPSTSSTHQYAPPRVAMHNIKFNTTDVPGVFHWGRICSQKLAGLEPASHVSEVAFAGMQHHPAQVRLEALLIGDRSLTLAISSASRATPISSTHRVALSHQGATSTWFSWQPFHLCNRFRWYAEGADGG